VTLDASAIIALLYEEPGGEVVLEAVRDGAVACVVNIAETGTILIRDGMEPDRAEMLLRRLPLIAREADMPLAIAAARMVAKTKPFGLSLGDRFCLALAAREERPVLTTDRIWKNVGPLLGLDIRVIR
jgi:ribonuclease VapC